MTAYPSRHFLLSMDFILPVLLLMASTVLFRFSNLDIRLQSFFYNPETGWAFNSSPVAKFIYHYGNIPALLTAIAALVVFILGFSKARYLPYRKLSIFLVLAMVVGPGILVNSILKDNWGRPRPREIKQFGGEQAYEAPLTYDATSPGKSFPCGHATMGFYFFAIAFLLRRHRPRASRVVLLIAALWGCTIGYVRMGQGGHFASDVLWAGLLVYLTSFLLYRAMALHKDVLYTPSASGRSRKLKLWQKVLLYLTGLLIILGVMLATPYSVSKVYDISDGLGKRLEINIEEGQIKLDWGNQALFTYKADGFGFPGSKIRQVVQEYTTKFAFSAKASGFFTELNLSASLAVDTLSTNKVAVSLGKGKVSLILPVGFRDTIYVSPRCKILGKQDVETRISKGMPISSRYWLDAEELYLSKD